tara:strand:+ start:1179 stop:1400 length:222 start_codon:yes stop_codon:yes gene_type:complete
MKFQTLKLRPGCLIVDYLDRRGDTVSYGLVIEKIKNKIRVYWFNIQKTIEYDLIDMEWFIGYYKKEGWEFYCP